MGERKPQAKAFGYRFLSKESLNLADNIFRRQFSMAGRGANRGEKVVETRLKVSLNRKEDVHIL